VISRSGDLVIGKISANLWVEILHLPCGLKTTLLDKKDVEGLNAEG
jgi:hypothetical protein